MGTMRTSTTEASRRPPGADGERVRRVLVSTALIGSAALTGLAVVWLFVPELDPHRSGDLESLGSVVFGPTASAVSTAAIGLAGVALAAALTRRGTHSRRWAALGAAGLSTLIAVVLGSLTTAVLAGYLFGMASVVAGIVTIGVMLVRSPRLGVVLLAGLLGLAAIAFWGAGITLAAAWSLATSFIGALAAAWQLLASATVILVTTLAWAAIAIIAIRVGPTGRAIETWLVRHRVALTVLAAIGPLPYAFARLSWLSPWPLFIPPQSEYAPVMLATGLMLGAGAFAASLLTLGLILPWGRTFPAWMPRVGGRPVPVATAAVPGSIASAVLCLSAVPMFVTVVGDAAAPADAVMLALVLPFWFWGPMLGLAVWAYVAWRSREATLTVTASAQRS